MDWLVKELVMVLEPTLVKMLGFSWLALKLEFQLGLVLVEMSVMG